MPFLTSGYPDQETFVKLLYEVEANGADLVEIGIPFSDPMADGKTIQAASREALNNGMTVRKTLEMIKSMPRKLTIPIILMSYLNPIFNYGLRDFCRHASDVGVSGLIVPDVIPDEGRELERVAEVFGIDVVYLLAPTSSTERIHMILNQSRGFVYLVSLAGVTGARDSLPLALNQWIQAIKEQSQLPVCVGFGISNVSQAKEIGRSADGIIIGSAIIDIIKKQNSTSQILSAVGEFITAMRKGLSHDSCYYEC